MWEVGNSTGGRARRWADAVVMSLWPSRGLLLTGIEIKVSRSDWQRELKDPAKAEEIAQYCDYWTVFAPEGIIQLQEVPALWGVKVVNEKGAVRQIKEPIRFDNPKPLDRGFVAAMLRRASTADADEIEAMVQKRLEPERAAVESRITRQVQQSTAHFEKMKTQVEAFRAAGINLGGYESPSQIAEFIRIGRRLKENSYSISNVKKNLTGLMDLCAELEAVLPLQGE
jgi:hypothetical protein